MKKEKILLITDVIPSSNYSGALMNETICKILLEQKHKIVCCKISRNKKLKEKICPTLKNKMQIHSIFLKEENSRKTSKASNNYLNEISAVVDNILEIIDTEKITKVWCQLQGEDLLLILKELSKKTSCNIYLQLFDPFDWILKDLNYSSKRIKELEEDLSKVLTKVEKCISGSGGMNKVLKAKYGISAIELYPSFKLKHPLTEYKNKENNKINVAFTGQTYAVDAITSLLNYFDSIDWKYNNKKIFFHYYGSNSKNQFCTTNKSNIVMHGYLSQEKLSNELNKMDILYCPYFFEKNKLEKDIIEQSFPSKLIFYLLINKPILFHGSNNAFVCKKIKEYSAGYILDTCERSLLFSQMNKIFEKIENENNVEIIKNTKTFFDNEFSKDVLYKKIGNAFNIKMNLKPIIKILQVNNEDIIGRRFNGYDASLYLNSKRNFISNQIVINKQINDDIIFKMFTKKGINMHNKLAYLQAKELSVQNIFSVSTIALQKHELFNEANIVHYHMFHNTGLSLINFDELLNQKRSVITLHDPWFLTGRCVHFGNCNKWKNECKNCKYLNTTFPFKMDNSNIMWKMKKKIFDNSNVDIVVSSKYMLDLFKQSPFSSNKNNIHLIPLGVNLKKFNNKIGKEKARKHFKIPNNDIVLFFRAQKDFKGTDYIVKALKNMKSNKKITLLTCSSKGLLKELEQNYNIIDLGNISEKDIIYAHNACDIFLMPSIGESFGMMAVEAMACSKPVIVFNNTALPEVTFAPKCGVLVKNKNSLELKKAILFLINDENERIKRGKLGRELAEKYYDEKIYNQRLLDLYQDIYKSKNNFKKAEEIEISENLKINKKELKKLKSKLNIITDELCYFTSVEYKKLHYKLIPKNKKDIKINYLLPEIKKEIMNYNEKLYGIMNTKNYELKKNFKGFKKVKKNIIIFLKRFKKMIIKLAKKFVQMMK